MPERLRRLERLRDRHPIYFVTACSRRRKTLFARPDIYQTFVTFGRNGAEHGAWIGAYVMMPDHLHLFVVIDDERITLSKWWKSLKNAISKALRDADVASPHWEKGFFDHVLRSSESYAAKWEYVRENPVRAGLVTRWQDWPYLGEIHDLEYRRGQLAL